MVDPRVDHPVAKGNRESQRQQLKDDASFLVLTFPLLSSLSPPSFSPIYLSIYLSTCPSLSPSLLRLYFLPHLSVYVCPFAGLPDLRIVLQSRYPRARTHLRATRLVCAYVCVCTQPVGILSLLEVISNICHIMIARCRSAEFLARGLPRVRRKDVRSERDFDGPSTQIKDPFARAFYLHGRRAHRCFFFFLRPVVPTRCA